MRPVSLITMAILAVATFWLVHGAGWSPLQAGLIVGGTTLGLVVTGLVVLAALLPAAERQELWRFLWSTIRQDFADLKHQLVGGNRRDRYTKSP